MTFLLAARTGGSVSTSREPGARTLQLAAAMFMLYGVAIVFNAVIFADMAGSANAGNGLHVLLHLLGVGFVVWGLLHGAHWARWASLTLALSVLAAGLPAISVFEYGDIYWLLPSDYQLFFVGGLLSVGAAIALLLAPSVRASHRHPRSRVRTASLGTIKGRAAVGMS